MEAHRAAVRMISASVKSYFDRSLPYRIFHGSTNSTRPAHRAGSTRLVDISALSHVLEVNTTKRTALVEPNVPMDRLVEHTLKHNLVPPVVMEFPGITAGGGFAGTAGESSSFRHGYFDENVEMVEMVLPDGEVVNVDRKGKYADLFRGATGAVGTLGITTLLELRLVEAKKFVKTTYRRTTSVAEAVEAVKEQITRKENEYVDGILFSKEHGVVITGELVDDIPAGTRPQTFSRAWDPWFYLHVKEKTRTLPSSSSSSSASTSEGTLAQKSFDSAGQAVDYIPLPEYLFRYDRGGFWVGQAAFDYFRPVPFTRFFRWFLDDFLHTRMLYRALHGSGESARFIVQDIGMPYDTAEKLVDYTAENLGIWPLWLCPLKTPNSPTFHPHCRGEREGHNEMLNIGVWGWGPKNQTEFVKANRELEAKVAELGGMKWFYAHTYYDEPDFWKIYGNNKEWYQALREKYQATSLPSVYDKVKVKIDTPEKGWKPWVKSVWPFGGLIGIWKGIKSKDYMLHRNATWKWKRGDSKQKLS